MIAATVRVSIFTVSFIAKSDRLSGLICSMSICPAGTIQGSPADPVLM